MRMPPEKMLTMISVLVHFFVLLEGHGFPVATSGVSDEQRLTSGGQRLPFVSLRDLCRHQHMAMDRQGHRGRKSRKCNPSGPHNPPPPPGLAAAVRMLIPPPAHPEQCPSRSVL